MVDKINGKGFGPIGNINRTGNAGVAKKSGEPGKTDRVDFSSTLQQASKAQATGTTQETARTEGADRKWHIQTRSGKGRLEYSSFHPQG